MTNKPARTVLLTGAAGVIGRAVAEQLGEHHVIGLVHSETDVSEVDEVLHGDLAQPRLGLSSTVWRSLAERVDVIVHSGALTQWGQEWQRYKDVNINGCQTVIEFARLAGAPVYLISTCFVHAIERGALSELGPDNVVKPYICSKLEAERMLVNSGVPYSIFRPTNLVGSSETGASSRPQIVQMMSDWFSRGKAPYFPAHPGNRVDVIPLDVTAKSIARAVEIEDLGATYWLTYGSEAMTVDATQDILLQHSKEIGRPLNKVPIVDPSKPLPVPFEEVPAISRSYLKVLIDVSEVTRASGGVLPTSLAEITERLDVSAGPSADAFRLSVQYWNQRRALV